MTFQSFQQMTTIDSFIGSCVRDPKFGVNDSAVLSSVMTDRLGSSVGAKRVQHVGCENTPAYVAIFYSGSFEFIAGYAFSLKPTDPKKMLEKFPFRTVGVPVAEASDRQKDTRGRDLRFRGFASNSELA